MILRDDNAVFNVFDVYVLNTRDGWLSDDGTYVHKVHRVGVTVSAQLNLTNKVSTWACTVAYGCLWNMQVERFLTGLVRPQDDRR